jgi:hypothetical protein
VVYKVKKKEAGGEVGVAHLVAVTGDDHNQKEVDPRKKKRVDDQPDLSKNRIEMLLVKF